MKAMLHPTIVGGHQEQKLPDCLVLHLVLFAKEAAYALT